MVQKLVKFLRQFFLKKSGKAVAFSTNLPCATTHLNKSGRCIIQAVTNRPPLLQPLITSLKEKIKS